MNQQSPEGKSLSRYLVFGDIGLQYPVATNPAAPLVVAELHSGEDPAGYLAVEYLRPADTATSKLTVLRSGTVIARQQLAEPMPTWRGTTIEAAFGDYLAQLDCGGGSAVDLQTFTPLMVLRLHRTADGDDLEVMMCTRVREVGAAFARVARLPVPAGAELAAVVTLALTSAHELRDCVGVEWQAFTSFEHGTEIELKIGLQDEISSWGLASRISEVIGAGGFTGFIPDIGNELQRWHFRQDTFEVLEPESERGYIAFIDDPDGSYGLKRKRFQQDALRREETFRSGLQITDRDFDTFLAGEYPELTLRRLPSFVRARFDVNVESAATGHFYGVEIDEVTVPDRGAVLRQVELEYHRSRIHQDLDAASIDTELYRLADQVEKHLAGSGIAHQRTFYSKLSFLRDCLIESERAVPAATS